MACISKHSLLQRQHGVCMLAQCSCRCIDPLHAAIAVNLVLKSKTGCKLNVQVCVTASAG